MRPRLIAVDDTGGMYPGAKKLEASMRPRLIAVDDARIALFDPRRLLLQ